VGALAWLLIPAVAVIVAAFWARWTTRRQVTHDGASLAGYERFRAAMESPPGPAGTPGPVSAADDAAGALDDSGARDGSDAQDGSGAQPVPRAEEPAPSGRAARRRRIIVSGNRAKEAHAARTASAQAASEAGGEDSPKGPVAGSVP
jgi:hypothetical protein